MARLAADRTAGSDCSHCTSGLQRPCSRQSCDELAAARCAARRPGEEMDELEIARPRADALPPRSDFGDPHPRRRPCLAPALFERAWDTHIHVVRAVSTA